MNNDRITTLLWVGSVIRIDPSDLWYFIIKTKFYTLYFFYIWTMASKWIMEINLSFSSLIRKLSKVKFVWVKAPHNYLVSTLHSPPPPPPSLPPLPFTTTTSTTSITSNTSITTISPSWTHPAWLLLFPQQELSRSSHCTSLSSLSFLSSISSLAPSYLQGNFFRTSEVRLKICFWYHEKPMQR